MARDGGRREQGTGSVFKRKDGLWAAQVLLGYNELGKPRYKTAYARSQADAVDALNGLQADLTLGKTIPTKRQTLGDFLDRWMTECVVGHKAPATERYYRLMVDRHIKPGLGRTDLRKLSAAQVQAFLNDRGRYTKKSKHKVGKDTGQPLSAYTIRGIRAVLRSALNVAWRWGEIGENVALKVGTPKILKADPVYLTPDHAKKLREAAKGHPMENLLALALGTGLRVGEATGLRWQDVDFEAAVLHVQVQLQRVGGKLAHRPLKSASSRRNLPLVGMALEALKAESTRQLLLKAAVGEEGFNGLGLVFLNADGRPLDGKYVDKHLKRLCDKAKIPEVSFHKLRHTAATHMVAAGVPLALVKEQLGHSSITLTTGTYAHMVPVAQREAALKLDRVLGGTGAKKRGDRKSNRQEAATPA